MTINRDGISATITGLPELKKALAEIPNKLRVRALRNALAAGARVVQKEARRLTPVLKLSTLSGRYAFRKGYRKPGTVRKAISVRTSKVARRGGDVGVFVNVRPAKRGARGGRNPRDPFYWRWINFGTASGVRAFRFLEAGASKLPNALQVFIAKIGPAIQKLNTPKAKAP